MFIKEFFFLLLCSVCAFAYAKPWVEWNPKSRFPFSSSGQINHHLWKLLPYHESQKARANCGIAASVAALNSLAQPNSPKFLGMKLHNRQPIYNQSNFFSSQVKRIVKQNVVEQQGISLFQLRKALKTYRWLNVYPYEGPKLSHTQLRKVLISSLKNPNRRVLGLFDRRVLQQKGTGHWSPIAAYDKKSDAFLVLDVAKFKYRPFWVKANALFKSMQTYYGHQPRGMLVIEKVQIQ